MDFNPPTAADFALSAAQQAQKDIEKLNAKMLDQMKVTVEACFLKYVIPKVEEWVAQRIEPLIEKRLRFMLEVSHDEWTSELTAALLRHVNAQKEQEKTP